MDPLRLDAAAARVVAWHNRHPLARRIAATQVHSVGYVALPFERKRSGAAPADAAADGALEAVFSEDFIAPLTPQRVARWAARHGMELAQPPADAPLRHVRRDRAPEGAAPVTLVLLTAAIEAGSVRSRVLIGAGEKAAVLGRRLWSGQRVAAAAALSALAVALVAAVLTLVLRPAAGGASLGPTIASAASAATATAAAAPASAASATALESPSTAAPAAPSAAASTASAAETGATSVVDEPAQPMTPVAAAPPQPAAPASRPSRRVTAWPAPAAASRPAVSRPLDLGPHIGRVVLPDLRHPLSDADRTAARQAVGVARAQLDSAARTPPSQAQAHPSARAVAPVAGAQPASAASAVAAAASAASAPPLAARASSAPGAPALFAVSTRALRTHAEAEQIQTAMQALLGSAGASQAKVEILPQGDDWRVVGWPFPKRDDAERARALLAARGMRVNVVGL